MLQSPGGSDKGLDTTSNRNESCSTDDLTGNFGTIAVGSFGTVHFKRGFIVEETLQKVATR